MKTSLLPFALALGCGLALASTPPAAPRASRPPRVAPATAPAQGVNWLMDGGDNQRSGWVKDETALTTENVKTLKLLWTVHTGNQPRALDSLMAPLVVDAVPTAAGVKQIVYVVGSSDNLYAIDAATGKMVWQRHFTYALPPARAGRGGYGGGRGRGPQSPAHLNFLAPGGSTDTPAIGAPGPGGVRPLYVTDGGGNLHTISTATGADLKPTLQMTASKFSLQLYQGNVIYAWGDGIFSANVDSPHPVFTKTVGFGGGGGEWGRRGPAIDSHGVVWSTTGDGQVNLTNPNHLILGNSLVGFKRINGDGAWKVVNWFTPPNWDWLRQRDLDPNNTPTIFDFQGHEYMVSSGKECRLYLVDPSNPGGLDHEHPLYKTPQFCNDSADFQNQGSWGALSSWQDADGTRYVLAPFWGPPSKDNDFPIVNTPVAKEGGEAAFKMVMVDGHPQLQPVWISRDMYRGEPTLIANGMVFAYGAGNNTQQAFPDIGLQFDSSIRAALSNRATIYALDAHTGKVLWSSGDQITSFSHFSGLAVANGKVYLGTYDGTFYCFGLPTS